MTGPRIFAPEYYARMRALESGSWWSAAMRDTATRWLMRASLPARGLLLDVGCGSGQTMSWFARHWPGWQTVGLDVSRDGLHAARLGTGQPVLGASATNLPLPDSRVDAIITLDVLQHLPLRGGDVRALAEMRRVLKPGGVLLVRTNAQSWPRTSDDEPYNFHKYSTGELRGKLEAAGFVVRRLGSLNALLGLAEIPRELRVRRVAGTGYAGLLAKAPGADPLWRAKHAWLRLEGSLVGAGLSLPLGRTILAIAHAGAKGGST
ncbi:MAG TPA: class I SAM-dependent methyltransferase [Gemmatimonadales bacterium]